MQELASWKTHTFTLFIFSGIVVLCSIFFILGMLVGRSQGQKIAKAVAADVPTKPGTQSGIKEDKSTKKPELTFFDTVDNNQPRPLEPPPPEKIVNFQIGAVRKSSDAEKLLDEAKKKGFRAFILAPPPGDPNPFYRVRVGPFADDQEAENIKRQLESAGYTPILKE
jgi:cell division septation protein DedD